MVCVHAWVHNQYLRLRTGILPVTCTATSVWNWKKSETADGSEHHSAADADDLCVEHLKAAVAGQRPGSSRSFYPIEPSLLGTGY